MKKMGKDYQGKSSKTEWCFWTSILAKEIAKLNWGFLKTAK